MNDDVLAQFSPSEWLVTEEGFDPLRANVYETLFTIGNGHLGTRGSVEEGHQGELSGTYLNGVYDAHDSPVIDLVNAPDWLSVVVRVDGTRLDVQSCTVLSHTRTLDLRAGVLHRSTVFEDAKGRRTRLETLRFASLNHRELCALRVRVTAENHGSVVTVSSSLDGRRRNLDRLPVYTDGTEFHPEVKWQKWAWSKHLQHEQVASEAEHIYLQTRTIDTGISLGYAASLRPSQPPLRRSVEQGYEGITEVLEFDLPAGAQLQVDKLVTIDTSRHEPSGEGADGRSLQHRCVEALAGHRSAGLEARLAEHRRAWAKAWERCDCEVVGDPTATHAVRFGIYHLLIAANPDDPTVNIGAKSLSGEGYRGHIFWDTEILMLPFFIFTQPQTARSLLRYRHHTLPGAREVARQSETRGARYPWESASSGREECPVWTTDGKFRFWSRDEEIHVSADVAYGIHTYLQATGDTSFLHDYGAEILFETSRFWVDRAEFDPELRRYALKQVMGPDEFHSHVDDNAFTNHLARWHLRYAVQVHGELARDHPEVLDRVTGAIGLDPAEVQQWAQVAESLDYFRGEDGLIEQFAGYFEREEVPITEWDDNNMPRYPEGYHHFNCEDTTLLKQPDVVMLTYLLPDEFTAQEKRVNFEFYEARTLHKSSLSPAIHAITGLAVGDTSRALQYFYRSALVDLTDNQGNTEEGMHIASAAGTWQVLVNGFGGLRVVDGRLSFAPWLPPEWEEIRFRLQWRGRAVHVAIAHGEATFTLVGEGEPETIAVRGRTVDLQPGQATRVTLAVPHE